MERTAATANKPCTPTSIPKCKRERWQDHARERERKKEKHIRTLIDPFEIGDRNKRHETSK